MVVVLFSPTTIDAKRFSSSSIIDQVNDGDFCNYTYPCSLSIQELSLLNAQDDQNYQVKDHTLIFPNGAWPSIYFAMDRYLKFAFIPNFLSTDMVLNSSFVISHKINNPQGVKGINYDIKLEASDNNGLSWEVLSIDLWPVEPNIYSTFQFSLPANYSNASSLNKLLIKLSIYGDDGHANLSSVLDLIGLDVDYFNTETNISPKNTIDIPYEDQQLKENIIFAVSAIDDFGIIEYELVLLDKDHNILISCLQETITSTKFLSASCQIDTRNYPNGEYNLQVKTTDNAGEWTTTVRSVVFDNTSPITDLGSLLPLNNTFKEGMVIISGISIDNLTTSFVDLYFRDSNTANPWVNLTTLVNSVTSSLFRWSYSWDPSVSVSPGEGIYDLAVSATDSVGNQEPLKVFGQHISYIINTTSSLNSSGNHITSDVDTDSQSVTITTPTPTLSPSIYQVLSGSATTGKLKVDKKHSLSQNASQAQPQVLGTTAEEPKTWMLMLSIFLSVSYFTYLLSRRH